MLLGHHWSCSKTKGFKSVQGGAYYAWLENRLRLIGDPVTKAALLTTSDFGLPQKRSRLYIVSFREDCAHLADEFEFPAGDDQNYTHRKPVPETLFGQALYQHDQMWRTRFKGQTRMGYGSETARWMVPALAA